MLLYSANIPPAHSLYGTRCHHDMMRSVNVYCSQALWDTLLPQSSIVVVDPPGDNAGYTSRARNLMSHATCTLPLTSVYSTVDSTLLTFGIIFVI
jgi:hypothetical protein